MSIPVDTAVQFSDDDLRRDLLDGLRQVDIARKYGVTRSAVNQRVKRLDLTTTSAIVAPAESQHHVRRAFDVMAQLARNVERANLLDDACDRWLRDPDDPARYEVGPRSDEVSVVYVVASERDGRPVFENRKAPLSELLAALDEAEGLTVKGESFQNVTSAEFKHADPRELVLKTKQETRMTAALVIEALQKLTDARMLQEWRKAVVEEIAKESPDVARRIADRIEASIVLYAAFAGPGTVPGTN